MHNEYTKLLWGEIKPGRIRSIRKTSLNDFHLTRFRMKIRNFIDSLGFRSGPPLILLDSVRQVIVGGEEFVARGRDCGGAS